MTAGIKFILIAFLTLMPQSNILKQHFDYEAERKNLVFFLGIGDRIDADEGIYGDTAAIE